MKHKIHLAVTALFLALIFGFGMMLIYNIVFLVQDIIALISPKKEDETV